MSLNLVQTGSPALTYFLCPAVLPPINFSPELCNGTTLFLEKMTTIEGFYYDISRDVYVLIAAMDHIFFP